MLQSELQRLILFCACLAKPSACVIALIRALRATAVPTVQYGTVHYITKDNST